MQIKISNYAAPFRNIKLRNELPRGNFVTPCIYSSGIGKNNRDIFPRLSGGMGFRNFDIIPILLLGKSIVSSLPKPGASRNLVSSFKYFATPLAEYIVVKCQAKIRFYQDAARYVSAEARQRRSIEIRFVARKSILIGKKV